MIECTDPIRVAAQAYYERTITPDNALRGALPLRAFEFTDFKNHYGIDTMEPKNVVHSHSSIDAFKTCPAQYKARYITKEIKFIETTATMYGNRGHKALENRLGLATPLPDEFKELEEMCQQVEKMSGRAYVEKELAVTEELGSTSFWDKQGWFRGKGDYIKFDADAGYLRVFDWKFGKPKKDRDQLERMALICYYNFPGVKKVKSAFVYPASGEVDTDTFTSDKFPEILQRLQFDIEALKAAHLDNNFPPRPSGLCRPSKSSHYPGCPVSSCAFNYRNL